MRWRVDQADPLDWSNAEKHINKSKCGNSAWITDLASEHQLVILRSVRPIILCPGPPGPPTVFTLPSRMNVRCRLKTFRMCPV
eukprot:2865378-Pyramimonas_sp.AAC.1